MILNISGIQLLSEFSLDDIVKERRVEFAFEDHRFWDLKRWRMAHQVWNGIQNDHEAQQYALFPYLIKDPESDNNGKWIFEKIEIGRASCRERVKSSDGAVILK